MRKNRVEQELSEELCFHLEKQTEQNIAQGMSPPEARYAARRQFGNVGAIKEECRDSWGIRFFNELVQDVCYGLRQLHRNPSFTAVAVLTLALGIGPNIAIFSIVEAVLLKDLPVARPGQLVQLVMQAPGSFITGFPYPHFEEFRDHNKTLSGVCAFTYLRRANGVINGRSEVIHGVLFTSDNYFSVLGVLPFLGHTYSVANLRSSDQNAVAVISYRYWKNEFGRDFNVSGQLIKVNGVPVTIIGVMPGSFFGAEVGRSPEVMIPITMQPQVTGYRSLLKDYLAYWVTIVGRLKSGDTIEQAQADLAVLSQHAWAESAAIAPPARRREVQEFLPKVHLELQSAATGVVSGLRNEYSLPLLFLMTVVGIVLLISCGNISGLQLERLVARRREIGVRAAIGAGRARLIRQFLTESLLLSALGCVAGLFLGFWGSRVLVKMVSTGAQPVPISPRIDFRVLAFTVTLSLLAGILLGIAPSVRIADPNLIAVLKEDGGPANRGGLHFGFGRGLVVLQVALTCLLLIGVGLLIGSFKKLLSVNPGFNRHGVLLFSLNGEQSGHRGKGLGALYERLRERIGAQPGIRAASFSSLPPLGGGWGEEITVPGQAYRSWPDDVVFRELVGPEYFKAMGIPLLLGREFTPSDDSNAPKVAILSESASRMHFGTENPVGRRIGLGPSAQPDIEVVGVVGDTKNNGLRKPDPFLVYTPSLQGTFGPLGVTFELRTATDPLSFAEMVRKEVRRTDESLPVYNVRTLSAEVSSSLVRERLTVTIAGLFSALALLLSCVGLYGVVAYMVGRKTHEIGIRMALGAEKRDILRMVVGEGLTLAVIGVGIGIASALALTRFLSSMLYGVKPTDPLTFIAVSLILIAVALVACYIPARRAARVDPMEALRYE